MTMQNNQKVCEINNFNITYKLSQNEYEFDYSNSSHNKMSNNSEENSGICLDKLCQQMSNSVETNKPSNQKTKSKSIKRNNLNNYVDNFFKNYYEMNKKKFRRSMTDFKGRKYLNKNNSKFQSFGLDVESIKEEKDEDNISICSFDYKINSKKEDNSQKKQESKAFTPISSFLETDSFAPVQKKNNNFCCIVFISKILLTKRCTIKNRTAQSHFISILQFITYRDTTGNNTQFNRKIGQFP